VIKDHVVDLVVLGLTTASCLSIQFLAPGDWRPGVNWLMFAPAIALAVSAVPTLLLRRRQNRIERRAVEQEEIVGLLLKDYAADRCDWLWSSDAEGKLRGVNDKFAVQSGRPAAAIEGVAVTDFLAANNPRPTEQTSEIVTAMRQKKPFFDIEVQFQVGGAAAWWRLAGKPVFRDGRFSGYIGTASDITAEHKAREAVNFLAYNDGLTGLANRSHFSKRLNECVARLERYGTPFSVLYLDLDKFKAVNDSRGHQAGDKLLVEIGRRLRSILRETDIVARLGGDEFSIILPDASDTAGLSTMAGRLIAEIEKPYAIDGDALIIGLSIGIAIAPINGTRPDQILRNADLALYRAKGEGGNRFCFFESRMDSEIRERRMLETEMADALEQGEFILHYQPIISTHTGTVSGFEALIRWNHPIRGMVSPGEFIPIAERSTLIGAIGEWTIREACRMLAQLPERLTIAVNLSTKHFKTADVGACVAAALLQSGVAANRLELEITESLLIDKPDDMAAKLRDLKRGGLQIAMDDFGTGFSSLSYLLKFPFDKIKIDRSFVSASSEDTAAQEILRTIVRLAATLEMTVTAEGVETDQQCDFLREIGCDLLQGFLFSRPLPEADTLALVGKVEEADSASAAVVSVTTAA
jgi:diguanylate cyclase (GGDEF)-like protein/PAS domain S-box-containing protein